MRTVMDLYARLLLVVAAASVATARNLTDEQISHFPKLFHLDDYERCLAKTDGLYCLGILEISPATTPHRIYELLKEHSDDPFRHFNYTQIHRGYCVSERCPTTHDRNASHRFERCVDQYNRRRELRASLRSLDYCRTHEEVTNVQHETPQQKLFMQIVRVLVVLNVIGTIYDVYSGSTLKIIGMAITTYAHACLMHFRGYVQNPSRLEEFTYNIICIFLSTGTSLIQTFVMLSSFLTVYSLLILSEKHKLSLKMLPMRVLMRVIRIMPVNLLIVGFAATWWIHTREGPLVSSVIGLETEACKNKFWSQVFFYNNMVDTDGICVMPTWFLPVDMHIYILTCALTLVMWRRRSTAIKLYTFLFVASTVVIGVIAYINNYKSMVFNATPTGMRNLFRNSRTFREFYISSWGALPACFLGMILGHIQYELGIKKIDLTKYKIFMYLQYLVLPLLATWPITGSYIRLFDSPVVQAAHIALDRSICCVFAALLFLRSFHIEDSLTRFFKWRGWSPLAKMNLTYMLLHWCINTNIATRPVAYYTSSFDVLIDWVSTNVLTYSLAVPITILVELPVQNALKSLLF